MHIINWTIFLLFSLFKFCFQLFLIIFIYVFILILPVSALLREIEPNIGPSGWTPFQGLALDRLWESEWDGHKGNWRSRENWGHLDNGLFPPGQSTLEDFSNLDSHGFSFTKRGHFLCEIKPERNFWEISIIRESQPRFRI